MLPLHNRPYTLPTTAPHSNRSLNCHLMSPQKMSRPHLPVSKRTWTLNSCSQSGYAYFYLPLAPTKALICRPKY